MNKFKTVKALPEKAAPEQNQPTRLVVAVSSSALFDLGEGHEVFLQQGVEAYIEYQLQREKELLKPGQAFRLVSKLLQLNHHGEQRVEVILLSRNSTATGLRVFNSIEHYGLPISRAAFCSGALPYRYANAFECDLYLSACEDDVRLALENGVPAALIMGANQQKISDDNELRIAFDGDAVLFSDASEKVYKQQGLQAFTEHETRLSAAPLKAGPFKNLLEKLHQLQLEFSNQGLQVPIKTALVTARSAPSHERVIRTLAHWGLKVDEAIFLGGLKKGAFLKAFNSDIFFDDQRSHCESVAEHVPAGHVLHGVANFPEAAYPETSSTQTNHSESKFAEVEQGVTLH